MYPRKEDTGCQGRVRKTTCDPVAAFHRLKLRCETFSGHLLKEDGDVRPHRGARKKKLDRNDNHVKQQRLTPIYLSQRARSWLRPALTNIILALKSSCFMMSVSSPASTSGLVRPWDSLQQCSISWWPQAMLSRCRFRMAMHKEALGDWPGWKRETHSELRDQSIPQMPLDGRNYSSLFTRLEIYWRREPNFYGKAGVKLNKFQMF